MRSAERVGLLVLLFLVAPACGSRKSVDLLPDSSARSDLGAGGNEDAGLDVTPDAPATDQARDTSVDTLEVDSEGPDAGDDVPMRGDLDVDLNPSDGGSAEVLKSLDGGAEQAGEACVAGTACSGQTGCSTGDEIDVWCRSMLVCQSGTLRPANHPFTKCGATAGSFCPATQPSEGTACTLQSQICSYPTGTCTCATGCEGGVDAGPCQKPKTWHCDAKDGIGRLPAGCPTQAPQLGQACPRENVICRYGRTCYQYEVTCRGGTWQPNGSTAFGGCA